MSGPESLSIRSYLLTLKHAPPAPLPDQRAGLALLVDNYVGHHVPLPAGTRVEKVVVNGMPGEWISQPDSDSERVLLYLHGGAYALGSCDSHRDLAARLSAASGVRVLLIEYRLAPEHVFPAAVDDARAAYLWLLAHAIKPEHIMIGGDSAGGGLTLALLLSLQKNGDALPAGAVLLSPWTDLVGIGESRTTREEADPWISAQAIQFVVGLYTGTEDAHNPLISPAFADLHGLPPLCIHVGNDEVLLDDAKIIAEHAQAAQVEVQLTVWEGMWHVFQVFAPVLPEGQQSIDQLGGFIRQQLKLS